MKISSTKISVLMAAIFGFAIANAAPAKQELTWMKVKASTKEDRSRVANTGASIESSTADYVIAYANPKEKLAIEKMGNVMVSFPLTAQMETDSFPSGDEQFHDYASLESALTDLAKKYAFIKMDVVGKSLEGRNLYMLTITNHAAKFSELDIPAVFFMGTHHAREHISTETPYLLAKYLAEQYANKDPRIMNLIDNRVIYILPLVNPDGSEFDISSGQYQMWRKNRRPNGDGTFGVDLNRNYSVGFGGEGSSSDTSSETYHGPSAFSEPETQVVKNFIDSHSNITELLTYHTFSKLILYPWGGKYDPVPKAQDVQVFTKMAQTMAGWNGYTPEQASQLYIASGDTCDWAYGTHGIFSFTFELDPGSMFEGGFYPGEALIQPVFQKNLEPALYLIEHADNPYNVIQTESQKNGLSSSLF